MGTPRGTYRVQVQPEFDLRAAAGLADYLRDLGATQLYSAPLLQSTPGSQHGYDVADHSHVNTELGGAEALAELKDALRAHGVPAVISGAGPRRSVPSFSRGGAMKLVPA